MKLNRTENNSFWRNVQCKRIGLHTHTVARMNAPPPQNAFWHCELVCRFGFLWLQGDGSYGKIAFPYAIGQFQSVEHQPLWQSCGFFFSCPHTLCVHKRVLVVYGYREEDYSVTLWKFSFGGSFYKEVFFLWK